MLPALPIELPSVPLDRLRPRLYRDAFHSDPWIKPSLIPSIHVEKDDLRSDATLVASWRRAWRDAGDLAGASSLRMIFVAMRRESRLGVGAWRDAGDLASASSLRMICVAMRR